MLTAPVVYIALARLDVVPDPRDETHLRHYIGIGVVTAALGIAVGALWELFEWRFGAGVGAPPSRGNHANKRGPLPHPLRLLPRACVFGGWGRLWGGGG